jgi:hypothetical protein
LDADVPLARLGLRPLFRVVDGRTIAVSRAQMPRSCELRQRLQNHGAELVAGLAAVFAAADLLTLAEQDAIVERPGKSPTRNARDHSGPTASGGTTQFPGRGRRCRRMVRGDDRTVGAELGAHLRAQGLPADSGVSLRWVRVRFLGVPLVFPNFDARRAVLVYHDVHHLLTGYDTSWRGEGEIGAFEIATGCKHYWAAWMFNFGGFLFGLCIAPRRTFCAFVRARQCSNYYGRPIDDVLHKDVATARRELGLDRAAGPGTGRDALVFGGWVLLTVVVHAGYVVLPLGIVCWIW